tara:strand:+ start:162 stop:1004 length:843 start_codon:yes stop_codon:yes gene_type:complete
MNLENKLKEASTLLKSHNILSHRLDAEILISHIMGIKRELLYSKSSVKLPKNKLKKFNYAISRRIKNEPIAYITGVKEFWNHNFIVNNSALLPRPETELLLYKLIDFFKSKKNIKILDIGTGSGCILLSLLKEIEHSKGIGIDISAKAINLAKINSKRLDLTDRVIFKVFNIDKFLLGKYDLVVSNPPYIPKREIKNLSKDITNYEPLLALNGGIDGLDLITKVIYRSNILLKKNGLLAIEIGLNQYKKVSFLLKQYKFRELSKEYDYKDNVRCIISTKM